MLKCRDKAGMNTSNESGLPYYGMMVEKKEKRVHYIWCIYYHEDKKMPLLGFLIKSYKEQFHTKAFPQNSSITKQHHSVKKKLVNYLSFCFEHQIILKKCISFPMEETIQETQQANFITHNVHENMYNRRTFSLQAQHTCCPICMNFTLLS